MRGGAGGRGPALSAMAAAYSATGAAWQEGPVRIYDRLAEVLVSHAPVSVAGATVLDVGAGTGAVGRAVRAADATRVVAVDASPGMLTHDPAASSPAVVGDALNLPFGMATFDLAVAAFVVNHLADPAAGLAEMRRVTRPGGALLASAYAADDSHPVKAAVEAAFAARGWKPEPWYAELRDSIVPLVATTDGCATAMRSAGLQPWVENVRVPFPELDAAALVRWRIGLAQHAPFFHSLDPAARQEVVEDAIDRLGDPHEPLVRSILVMAAIRA